jgi:XrtJ-associated TM-motif-TM protein
LQHRTYPPASGLDSLAEKGFFMKKNLLLIALAVGLIAVPAFAQDGCNESPENPTLILAGLAGGAYTVSQLRMRIRARRTEKK